MILLIGTTVGRTAEDVTFIEKGKTAPFSGVLFPEETAKQLRSELLEADKSKLRLESELSKSKNLSSIIELKDTEIESYRTQNQRLLRVKESDETMKYIWFGLGVLVTGAAVYGAGSLSK